MLSEFLRRPLSGEWKTVTLVAVMANAIFLSLALLTTLVPHDPLRQRILAAFESGVLPLETDVNFETWMFGNECLILQMLLNEDNDRLRQALGPIVYYRDDDSRQCHLVRELARHGQIAEAPQFFRYTRYWHGHNAAAAALLSLMDFRAMRVVLRAMGYGSLVLLAVAGWFAARRLKFLAIATAVAGTAFWALQDFAHSLGNGPADTVLILGLGGLLLAYGRAGVTRGYVSCCAAFGAVVTYMEFFMGQLPTAAALLFPVGYFLADGADTRATSRQRWHLAVSGVLAFVLGAGMTIVAKQALAYGYFGAPALAAFTTNLDSYTQNLDQLRLHGLDNHLASAIYALGGIIWKWGKVLTYGSDLASRLLFFGTALAWCGAAALAWRSRDADARGALLACVAGAGIVAVWVAVFPTHSFGHGWFMVRIMVAPIALGWAALVMQFASARTRKADRNAEVA